jgi:hypothetical protein
MRRNSGYLYEMAVALVLTFAAACLHPGGRVALGVEEESWAELID